MPDEKKSNGYAADTIANEGAEYAVRHYCSGEIFKDPRTTELWNAAEKSLNDLIRYLNEETGRDLG